MTNKELREYLEQFPEDAAVEILKEVGVYDRNKFEMMRIHEDDIVYFEYNNTIEIGE